MSQTVHGRARRRALLPIVVIVAAVGLVGVGLTAYYTAPRANGPPSIASALGITPPIPPAPTTGNPCAAGESCYVFPIQVTTSGLTWSNVALEMVTPGGTVVTTVQAFLVHDPVSGSSLVWETGDSASAWSGTVGATVTTAQTVAVDAGPARAGASPLAGDALEVIGQNGYAGSFLVQVD